MTVKKVTFLFQKRKNYFLFFPKKYIKNNRISQRLMKRLLKKIKR